MLTLILLLASVGQIVCSAILLKASQEPEPSMGLHRCLECGSIGEFHGAK